jgi:hypothetical protein
MSLNLLDMSRPVEGGIALPLRAFTSLLPCSFACPTEWIFMKLEIEGGYEKLSEKIQIW